MTKSKQSILLVALLAASGFAFAQNAAAPATGERKLGTGEPAKSATGTAAPGTTVGTTPAVTRAEVKSETGTADRKLGTGETAKPNMSGSAATQGNTSGTTRAEVKSDAGTEPRKLGTGEAAKSANTTGTTRAEVKSEVGTEPRKLGTGEAAKSGNTSASNAERKRMRDERRAAAKAKREANMKSGSSKSVAPATEKAK